MIQPVGILLSIIGGISGTAWLLSSLDKHNGDNGVVLLSSIIIVFSLWLLFTSLYSLEKSKLSERTNKLLQELIDLKTGEKSNDSQEPQNEGINTTDALLNKLNK